MYPTYHVYVLKCADGSFYTGSSSNLAQRIAQHERGTYPENYTYNLRPVTLVWQQEFPRPKEMVEAERRIKGWTRKKKIGLIEGRYDDLKQLLKDHR